MSHNMFDFIEEVASDKPSPASGSSSAISGALGCALLMKATKILLKKKDHQEDDALKSILIHLETAKDDYLDLAFLDQAIILEYMETIKNKESNEKDNPQALIRAIELPLKVMRHSLKLIPTIEKLLTYGPYWLTTDIVGAVLFIDTALKGSSYNAIANLHLAQPTKVTKDLLNQHNHLNESWDMFYASHKKKFDTYIVSIMF